MVPNPSAEPTTDARGGLASGGASPRRPGLRPDRAVSHVLIGRQRIARRVEELAAGIAECYRGRELTILVTLKGAVVFLADLIRLLPLRVRLEIVRVSSYPGRATQSRGPRLSMPPDADLAGRDVLVVDDILDSGRTLQALIAEAAARNPASLRSCVLLRKRRDDLPDRGDADFVGFDIDNVFVVGYGLDYDEMYRNLPDVCVLGPPSGEEAG